MLAINLLAGTHRKSSWLIESNLAMNARAAGAVLNLLGEGVTVRRHAIGGARFSLIVAHGCDAFQPATLFISAVLATPVAWKRRLVGLAIGLAVLAPLNVLRIVSLYFLGGFSKRVFDVIHVDVWGAVFILVAITLWLIWAIMATRTGVQGVQCAAMDHTTDR